MLRMTASIAAANNRLVLVGPARGTRGARGRDSAAVRRYRLARLRVEGERQVGEARYAHLKRTYD
jgi:hypothetical protein